MLQKFQGHEGKTGAAQDNRCRPAAQVHHVLYTVQVGSETRIGDIVDIADGDKHGVGGGFPHAIPEERSGRLGKTEVDDPQSVAGRLQRAREEGEAQGKDRVGARLPVGRDQQDIHQTSR